MPTLHVLKYKVQSNITTCPHLNTLDSYCHQESCKFWIKAPTFTFKTYHCRQIAWGFLESMPMENIEYYNYMTGWLPLKTIQVLSKKQIFIIWHQHKENHNTNYVHLGLTEFVQKMETCSGLPHWDILPDPSPSNKLNQLLQIIDSDWITMLC